MKFFKNIFRKFIPDANDRNVAKIRPLMKKVIALEEEYAKLSDKELKAKTEEFKKALADGKTLDDILAPAFATVREASHRVLGMKHFPEQVLGGIALHKGMIAEMKTGEGKTLVATLPSYLNALKGPVHVVTVNDYLAKRDADEMGQIHRFLGLSAGCILESLNDQQRQSVYSCDIVYSTNNQLGFDYLKDNMKYRKSEVCQRELNYAIIDEADSVLIDEARTPLIISGNSEYAAGAYSWVSSLVSQLSEGDYEKDEKMRTVVLTDEGIEKIENMLRLEGMLEAGKTFYDVQNIELVHNLNQALKAHMLFKRDIDYMVKDGNVYIIDEFTGRVLEGRRYSDGLHQAIEAKEGVEIQNENQTQASITFQKFFALYNKISGMSGTCMGESEEFQAIYGTPTIAIPTHRKMVRQDLDDEIYRTLDEKIDAIMKEIKEAQAKQQPVLVITGSIEASEIFANAFRAAGLKHQVLNAKYHKEEAEIIAEAGCPGAITIATNMAGRGTDIKLGGSLKGRLNKLRAQGMSEVEVLARRDEIQKEIEKAREVVINAGGLYVLGTERNESRRVDDQARGRSGRQGDLGKSKFFISLEDSLIRVFGSSNKLDKWLLRFGLKQGEAIIHPFITRAIAKAQAAVEARNFDWRKNVFKYDQVLDEQRKLIYKYRNRFLDEMDIEKQMLSFVEFRLNQLIENLYINQPGEVDVKSNIGHLQQEVARLFNVDFDGESIEIENTEEAAEKLYQQLHKLVIDRFNALIEAQGVHLQMILLRVIDDLWRDHLQMLENLRQSVNLKAYAQKDPLVEYKKEAFIVFENLLNNFRDNSISFFFHLDDGLDKEKPQDIKQHVVEENVKQENESAQENKQPIKKSAINPKVKKPVKKKIHGKNSKYLKK